MTVYVDVLIFLNAFVNYFILLLTSKLCFRTPSGWRQIGAAFVGALFSLYIFLPNQATVTELVVRLASSAVIIMICYGFQNLKAFFRLLFTFYAASFLYAGLMMAFWYMAHPNGMVINNGIVYFDLSPVILICATVCCYLIIVLFRKLTGREATMASRCKIHIVCNGKQADATALLDSGNSMQDLFSGAGIVVVDRKVGETLFGEVSVDEPPTDPQLLRRFRLVPYKTVGGEGLLPSFRSDCVEVHCKHKTTRLDKAVVAVSNSSLGDDYDAIVNPEQL